MAFAADHMVSHIYRVEVSGWDQEKSYFVEKSELEWDESGEKYVTLTREIPKDSMVFVRLLQAMSQQQSFPIPYVAELRQVAKSGERRFHLKSAHTHAKTEHGTETVKHREKDLVGMEESFMRG